IAPIVRIGWEQSLKSREERTAWQQQTDALAKVDGSVCGKQAEAAVLLSRGCDCGSSPSDLAELEEYAGRVVALRPQLGPESIHLARALQILSEVYLQRGELDRATEYANQALAILERRNRDSVRVGDSLWNLASIAEQRGNLGEGETLLRRYLA